MLLALDVVKKKGGLQRSIRSFQGKSQCKEMVSRRHVMDNNGKGAPRITSSHALREKIVEI